MEAALSTFHNLQLLADAPTRLASVNLVYPPDVAFGSLGWGVFVSRRHRPSLHSRQWFFTSYRARIDPGETPFHESG
jgi:hypothetical protein